MKFIGPIFDVSESNKCSSDDLVVMKQTKGNGDLVREIRCGSWLPPNRPNKGSFLFTNWANPVIVQFSSKKRLHKNGRGFQAEICGYDCE